MQRNETNPSKRGKAETAKMNKMWGEFRTVVKRVTIYFFKMKRKGIGEKNEKQTKASLSNLLENIFSNHSSLWT